MNGVGQSIDFISLPLAIKLRDHLLAMEQSGSLFEAGIGQQSDFHRDAHYRRDKICWLEPSGDHALERLFFKQMDDFVTYLNATCFTGVSSYEFHYALYEKGSFYRKHIDRFADDDRRMFTMILYLNDMWTEGDGGELVIYHPHRREVIAPRMGTMVFFDSSALPHEVLETQVPRYSITGWLKRKDLFF